VNVRDDLERQLADWLAEVATPRDVELADVFTRTRSMNQRYTWTFPATWPAIPTAGPRTLLGRGLTGLALAVLIVGLMAAMLIIGSRPHVPPLFGPARTGLVAYEAEGKIYVEQPDGTGRAVMVGGPDGAYGATWSPDGTHLAYWTTPDPRYPGSLWVVGADGSEPVDLTGERTFGTGFLAWSPDGKRLAWASHGELRVIGLDGTDLRRIGDPAMAFDHASWSPDGAWIAVRGPADDPATFRGYVIRPDGTDLTPFSAATFIDENHGPYAWAPEGRSIAYHAGGPTDFDIAVARLDPSGVWRDSVLIDGDNFDVLPSWSNDGSRLAFIRTDGRGTAKQTSRLMVAKSDGSDAALISDRPVERSTPPCWSPDDRSILIASYSTVDLRPTIDLVAVDGSGVVEISAPGGAWAGCAWQRLAP
jgi:dipeptidyl aminopeptidase/acylaminoacyl peptidase